MIFITARFRVLPEDAAFTAATRAGPGYLWFDWSGRPLA
jgi:hypothetical protein